MFLIAIISSFIFSIIGIFITFSLGWGDLSSLLQITDFKNIDVRIIKLLQIFQSIGLFIIPGFVMMYFFTDNSPNVFKTNRKIFIFFFGFGVLVLFISMPGINFIYELNKNFAFPDSMQGLAQTLKDQEQELENLTKLFLKTDSVEGLLVNLLMIGIIPAIGEEFFFRGAIQRLFQDWFKNSHTAILVSAVIFSAFHLQFYGFFPRIVLGIMLGYSFLYSGTIWIPVVLHFINNSMIVLVYYIFPENISENIETVGSNSVVIGCLSLGLLTVGLYLWSRYSRLSSSA